MNSLRRTALLLATLLPLAAIAADAKDAKKNPRDGYPLDACVVSDEKFEKDDKLVEYIHKETGKPDRKILLCCDGCIDDFKKEPAKYLAKLDAAAAEKAKAAAKKKS